MLYINQLGTEKSENIHNGANPPQQPVVRANIRGYLSKCNQPIQGRKSHVHSEKRFNTEDKAKPKNIHIIQQHNDAAAQNVYFVNSDNKGS